YFFVSELLHPSRWTRVAYVATSVLAMYAHFFAMWILMVQLLTLLSFRRDVLLTRRWLSVVAAIGLGYLPAAAQIARFGHANIGWIPRPTLRTLVHTSARLAGGHWALLLLAPASAALKEDWRDAPRYVLSHEHPGHHVVFYGPHGQSPFDYYAHLGRNPGPSFSDLADGPRSGRRLWLVRLHEPANSPVVRGFGRRLAAAGYRLVSARVFSPLRARLGVSLYARRG